MKKMAMVMGCFRAFNTSVKVGLTWPAPGLACIYFAVLIKRQIYFRIIST